MKTVSYPSIYRRSSRRAFTLIELLAVITIIGVLASLTVGVTALVARKSKEARTRAELAKIELAIRNYHSKFGFYPPDNVVQYQLDSIVVDPTVNQLYYELTGAVFDRATDTYRVGAADEQISRNAYQAVFGGGGTLPGINNSSVSQANVVNFLASGKAGRTEHIAESPHVDVLVAPVAWPANHNLAASDSRFRNPIAGLTANPWRYVSTIPTNNPGEFDLWAEIVIGDEIVVIGNWEEN